ncbi:MAG TPA: hypothetical protein VF218_10990 [Acidothermaceae bacterium]
MTRLGPAVAVDPVGGDLVVRLRGFDMLVAFRRTLRIPVGHVRGVVVQHRDRIPQIGFHFPGLAVPGVMCIGAFGFGDERSFWHVRRAELLLRVECLPGAEFRRLVLQVPDPTALAMRLRPVLGAYVPPESV